MMREHSTLMWLTKQTNKYRFLVVLLTILEIVISGLGVCYALVMKQMVDQAVAKDSRGFVIGIVAFGLLIISQLVLRIITRQLSESVRSGTENTLKKNLFAALLKKDYASVALTHSEEWMNRLTSDTSICANALTEVFPGFFGMMIRLVGSLLLIFLLQPQLAYIVLPGGIVFLLITGLLRNQIKHFHKDVQEKDGQVRVCLKESISSQLVLRSFGVEDFACENADDAMLIHKASRIKRAWISNLCNTGFSLAINGMYLLGIGYCGYGIIHGLVSFGTLTAIIQLIGQLQSPLASLGGYVPRYYSMIASAERLGEVEQYEDVDITDQRSKDEVQEIYEHDMKEIAFSHVSFRYPKNVMSEHTERGCPA